MPTSEELTTLLGTLGTAISAAADRVNKKIGALVVGQITQGQLDAISAEVVKLNQILVDEPAVTTVTTPLEPSSEVKRNNRGR